MPKATPVRQIDKRPSGTLSSSGIAISGAAIVTPHSNLQGLTTEDDHTQYLNTTRGDARYYPQTSFGTVGGTVDANDPALLNGSGVWPAAMIDQAADYTWTGDHEFGGTVTSTYLDNRYVNVTGDTMSGTLVAAMVRQVDTWHAYGGFQDQTETITIGSVDVWYHVTNATNDLWTGLEADGMTLSGDVMTVVNAGDYIGQLSLTFSGLQGKDFEFRIYNNTQGTAMGYHIGATTTGATNYTNVGVPLFLECDAGDALQVEVRCVTDASNPTFTHAIFWMTYLHD